MGDGESIRIRASAAIVRHGKLLVVKARDERGDRSTLPGGAVKPGEPVHDALRREVREETRAEIQVGRLLLVSEFVPSRDGNEMGPHPEIDLIFACELAPGTEPHMPDDPDPGQLDTLWVPLEDLNPDLDPPLRPSVGIKLLRALKGAAADDPFCISVTT
jgi:ADP-ribose pyrophosphatase YjhB (NUDIX family)